MEYARTDTRYLLHIYARMRDELLALGSGGAGGENVLRATVDDCNRMCMVRYKKPAKIDSDSHMNMVGKKGKPSMNGQHIVNNISFTGPSES